MNKIKVSIIIPIYNVENYLRECLDSAINQTLKEIEIICVNDGSTDSSIDILNEYKSIYPELIIVNQENKGLSGARNTGLNIANGEYIYFFDSDDIIDNKLCEECYNLCKENDLDIITFDAEVFYDKSYIGEKNFNYNRKNLLQENIVFDGQQFYNKAKLSKAYRSPVWLYLYKYTYLKEKGLNFFEGILHEDELFTSKAILQSEKIMYISKFFFKRRVRKNSIMTVKMGSKNAYSLYIIANEVYDFYQKNKNFMLEESLQNLLKAIITYYARSYTILQSSNYKEDIEIKNSILNIIKYKSDLKNNMGLKNILVFRFPYLYKILLRVKNKILRY